MNFEFSADQMQLKDIARKFLEKEESVKRARKVLEGEESFDHDQRLIGYVLLKLKAHS